MESTAVDEFLGNLQKLTFTYLRKLVVKIFVVKLMASENLIAK